MAWTMMVSHNGSDSELLPPQFRLYMRIIQRSALLMDDDSQGWIALLFYFHKSQPLRTHGPVSGPDNDKSLGEASVSSDFVSDRSFGVRMQYCGVNDSLSLPWINHGFGICFLHTLGSSIIGLWILICGTMQLFFYRKYATRLSEAVLPHNKTFKVQIFCHFTLTSLAALSLIVRHGVHSYHVLGYEILDFVAQLIIWPLALSVLLVERNFQLPSAPSHGHGFVLITTWTLAFVWETLKLLSLNNEPFFYDLSEPKDQIELALFCLEYLLVFVAFFLGMKAPGISQTHDYLFGDHSDIEAILPDGEGGPRNQDIQRSTWQGLWKKLGILLPYMWPKRSFGLQLRVLLCLLLLAGVRVANVFVPIYYKKIVDALTPVALGEELQFCWDLIAIFVALKLIQGGGTGGQGILNNIRSFLWIRVQQYTTREIQVGLFEHLHHLSLRWHLSRKTGEVLRIMDRGTNSINGLLSYLIFNILPTVVDIVVAIIYFSSAFNIWFGLIVLVTMIIYLAITVGVTEWRTKYRRSMNLADNDQRTKGVDSLLNFETVKYYGAEKYEIDRYQDAILSYQSEEYKSQASLTLLNAAQSGIINAGLLVGSLYCGLLVTQKRLTPGDYVLFGTYILQLMVPLNFLGTLYRVIQESFINMENMLELMDEEREVSDIPNALPIVATQGKIEFRNVDFHYNSDRSILKNVSFIANPGETIAMVGATGSGKSTMIRLLFRFYDVQGGEILIDGQNIQSVTQASVRKAIGVVPQDTVLFNDTIRYNIRYGRPEATDEEVEDAARHADIHDKITTFPDGYDTKVGERGLKLSGGEKQRVAIARTLLKSPKIVLLDEATSALDTQTERNIQNALNQICQDRTTIVVAHRLSTITHANCILVISDGEIVERGRHEELLAQPGGKYAAMWNQQSQKNNEEDYQNPGQYFEQPAAHSNQVYDQTFQGGYANEESQGQIGFGDIWPILIIPAVVAAIVSGAAVLIAAQQSAAARSGLENQISSLGSQTGSQEQMIRSLTAQLAQSQGQINSLNSQVAALDAAAADGGADGGAGGGTGGSTGGGSTGDNFYPVLVVEYNQKPWIVDLYGNGKCSLDLDFPWVTQFAAIGLEGLLALNATKSNSFDSMLYLESAETTFETLDFLTYRNCIVLLDDLNVFVMIGSHGNQYGRGTEYFNNRTFQWNLQDGTVNQTVYEDAPFAGRSECSRIYTRARGTEVVLFQISTNPQVFLYNLNRREWNEITFPSNYDHDHKSGENNYNLKLPPHLHNYYNQPNYPYTQTQNYYPSYKSQDKVSDHPNHYSDYPNTISPNQYSEYSTTISPDYYADEYASYEDTEDEGQNGSNILSRIVQRYSSFGRALIQRWEGVDRQAFAALGP
eukprot:maker-scaffold683_size112676-snap-gene-0.16 protein:Tk08735 transcript:maker-scaffold683_size112676-snap-gene-0.16-mRNA-1 annotation:"atp-binding cassette sub-family b member mitochondrial isoform x1"